MSDFIPSRSGDRRLVYATGIPSQIRTRRIASPIRWTSGEEFQQELANFRRKTLHLEQTVAGLQRDVGSLEDRLSMSQLAAERTITKLRRKLKKARKREKVLLRLAASQERNDRIRTAGVEFFAGANDVNITNSNFTIYCEVRKTRITFTDATGEQLELCASDYEGVISAIDFLMRQDTKHAQAQRKFVQQREFDLCVHQGCRFIPLKGQDEWSAIQQGVEILMRVIIRQQRKQTAMGWHQCPRCKAWNDGATEEGRRMIHCTGCRSQFSISDEPSIDSTSSQHSKTSTPPVGDMSLIRYFHVKREEWQPKVSLPFNVPKVSWPSMTFPGPSRPDFMNSPPLAIHFGSVDGNPAPQYTSLSSQNHVARTASASPAFTPDPNKPPMSYHQPDFTNLLLPMAPPLDPSDEPIDSSLAMENILASGFWDSMLMPGFNANSPPPMASRSNPLVDPMASNLNMDSILASGFWDSMLVPGYNSMDGHSAGVTFGAGGSGLITPRYGGSPAHSGSNSPIPGARELGGEGVGVVAFD